MKAAITAMVFLTTCTYGARCAHAQPADVAFFSDYEVFVADPDTTDWYVQRLDEGGDIVDSWGPYDTRRAAEQDLAVIVGHGSTSGLQVVEITSPLVWRYYGTYGTLQEAEDVAGLFEDFGLLVDIRWVPLFDIPLVLEDVVWLSHDMR